MLHVGTSKPIHVDIGASFYGVSTAAIDAGYTVYLIEPVIEYVEILRNSFNNCPNVIIVNCAISNETGQRKFRIFNSQKAIRHGIEPKKWMLATCGFDPVLPEDPRDEIDWQTTALKEELYDTILVQCLSWNDFLTYYKIDHIDSIKIDAEGYDLEILKSVDFNRLKLTKLQFEYFLVANRFPAEYKKMLHKLQQLGFKLQNQDRFNIVFEKI